VAALRVVGLEVLGLAAPGRTETVGHVPTATELPAAVEPATVAQHALAHLTRDRI
jgi:hypothetical protein